MALIELNIYSESLRMQTEVLIVMPQKSNDGEIGINAKSAHDKCKVLYLLHGLSDDNTIWMRRTSIERYASELGVAVVMPNASRSFYTDMHYGGKFYTYVAKELPRIIEGMFNISDKREDKFIAGLSMGGYGALKIGIRECDSFSHCAGLSSVADLKSSIPTFRADLINIFGEDISIGEEDDLFSLYENNKANPNKPRVFMGVGVNDPLYPGNKRLSELISDSGYDFTYRESAGTHSWAFWDEYIQHVLKWIFNK